MSLDDQSSDVTVTNAADSEREVGYRKPPEGRPFKPGQSGNPGGRPKGSKKDKANPTLGSEVEKAFNSQVVIRENGKARKISVAEATAKQIANASASGHLASIKLANSLIDTARSEQPEAEAPLTKSDEVIANALIARIRYGFKYDPDHGE